MSILKTTTAALLALVSLGVAADASAADGPGIEAIDEFRNGRPLPGAVENRFFLKGERFEVAPVLGYVPNNPFAKRYVGGVGLAYHFGENLAVEGQISYSPDLNEDDLKGLTVTLVQIAETGESGSSFRQPLDKITLSANFGARWAPLYGKINLIGETVLNFDLYGVLGLAMLSKTNYHAEYSPEKYNAGEKPVELVREGNEVKVGPMLGAGFNFFLNQAVALKIDARFSMYVDQQPQYDDTPVTEQRLYNNFVASAGLAFFFPKMKPRMYNF